MGAEFWILVADVVVSAVIYFGGKYLAPSIFEDLKWAVLAVQPIVLAIIGKLYADRKAAEVQATIRGG